MENEKDIMVKGKVEGKVGPGEVISVRYVGGSGALKLTVPGNVWSFIYSTLSGTASVCFPKDKPKYKYIYAGTAEWLFMTAFDWIREFPGEQLEKILGCSDKCLSYTGKLLEQSGLCVIDKSLHFMNQFSKKKGQGRYQWTPVIPGSLPLDGADTGYIDFDYDVEGTPFGGMLDKYADCDGLDEYVPEKREGWGSLDKDIYESPYYDLTYRFSGTTFKARLFECYWIHAAVSRFGIPPVQRERLYNGFHYLPHVLRKNVYYNGSRLTELFDLHCSFYTISVGMILERYPDIDHGKVVSFYWDCALGKLYDKCSVYTGSPREIVKDKLQGWRNLDSKWVAHNWTYGYSKFAEFMESEYPEISEIYYNWPKYTNRDGEVKKALQHDLSEYETRLMSKLAFEIEDKYNVKCLLLHDAIYVCEQDKAEKLPPDIEKIIFNWFETNIL